MFKLSYFCFVTTVVSLTLLQCTNRICSAVAVDLNKEIPNLSHNSYSDPSNEFIGIVDDNGGSHVEWVPLQAIGKSAKRSLEDFQDLPTEYTQEDILNMPLHTIDKDKLQNSPWLKYLVIRKESLLYYLQEKRNREFNPRLGRSSSSDDDDGIQPRARPVFAPRLGKKSLAFSPRLGRQYLAD